MVPSCLQGTDAVGSLLSQLHPLIFIACPECSIPLYFFPNAARRVILPFVTSCFPFSSSRWASASWSSAKLPAGEPR